MTCCPICREPLTSDDELLMEWYDPCKWWVMIHRRNGDEYCAQADCHGTIARNFNARHHSFHPSVRESDNV